MHNTGDIMKRTITSIMVTGVILVGGASSAYAATYTVYAEPITTAETATTTAAEATAAAGVGNNVIYPQKFQSEIFTREALFTPVLLCPNPVVIHKDALNSLVIANGKNGIMMFHEPETGRTFFCRSLTEAKIANGEDPCKQELFALDGDDGKTTHLVMDKEVVTGNIAALSDDFMKSATPYMEALQSMLGNKDLPSCDTLKDVMLNDVKSGKVKLSAFLPGDSVPYGGKQVKTDGPSPYAIAGNRVFVIHNDQAKFVIPVVGVFTFGENTTTSYHPIADPTLPAKSNVKDISVTAMDGTQATVNLFFGKEVDGKSLSSLLCRVALTGDAPAICDQPKSFATNDASGVVGFVKNMVGAKMVQEGRKSGFGEFGEHIKGWIEKNVTDLVGVELFEHPVFGGFKDDKVNRDVVLVDKGGSVLVGEDVKGEVSQDPREIYPGFDSCYPTGQAYGGKGNICFSPMLITKLININQAPVINTMTSGGPLSADVHKESGETLKYHWVLLDGQGNDVSHLIDNPDAESPALNLTVSPMTVQPIKAVSGNLGVAPDITLNAAIIDKVKSVGAKAEAEEPPPAYFVVLKVTDAGGMSDVAIMPIPTKAVGLAGAMPPDVRPTDKAVGSPASFFGLEGGCSLSTTASSSNFVWILLIPTFMTRVFRKAYRRK